MPLPRPRKDEAQDVFIARCMGHATMVEDFPDQDQRAAVCYTQWREREMREAMALSHQQIREQLCMQVAERWGYRYWVRDIYPEYLIVEEAAEMGTHYYRMPYTVTEDKATLGEGKEEVHMMVEYLPMTEAAILREAADADGWQWQVVLIAPGLSRNGVFYPAEVLREAAALFEGVRALSRSDEGHLADKEKSVENIVGWFDQVQYTEGVGLVGTFHITADADWLRLKIRSAWDQGKTDLVQFSIVASGTGKRQVVDGKLVTYVEAITHAEFVDTVVNAAAGGRVLSLVASQGAQKGAEMLEQLLKLLEAKRPDLHAKIDKANVTEAQVLLLLNEAVLPTPTPTPTPAPTPAPAADPARLAEAETRLSERERAIDQRFALADARIALREAMSACVLPQAARDRIRSQFQARLDAGTAFTEAELTTAIDAERAYLGQLHQTGVVRGFGPGVASSLHITEAVEDKWPEMLDAFFDYRNPERKSKVHSFKECYVAITGDSRVTGRLSEATNLHGAYALRESISTSTFDQLLADALNKQLVREYLRLNLTEWRAIVDVVPANDFKTRHRVRLGGYANLPAVSQGAAYAALTSPTDEEATYAVSKRGGTEDLTLEAIRNDDVGGIRLIPVRLARAAAQTLHEFVFDLLATNPTIYDGVALGHASHANLGTTAFAAAEYMVRRRMMRDQTELDSAKALGLLPANLIIPNELEETAYNAFRQDTNLEPRLAQTNQVRPRIILVDYWTDATNWFQVCDPMNCPTIEVAFLDGREEPEIFVQDMPEVGSMFTNDKRTYKIRHVYGGAWVDYRGVQVAIVAG